MGTVDEEAYFVVTEVQLAELTDLFFGGCVAPSFEPRGASVVLDTFRRVGLTSSFWRMPTSNDEMIPLFNRGKRC